MTWHVDVFTSLHDLTYKQKRDPVAVLRALHHAGRYSSFECNRRLCVTLWKLTEAELIRDVGGTFPWHDVKLTAKGLALLELSGNPG